MHIGFCRIQLRLYETKNLKAKRAVLLPLKSKLHRSFNIACAETGDYDLPNSAVIGVSCVSNSGSHAKQVIDEVIRYLYSEGMGFQVVEVESEIVTF